MGQAERPSHLRVLECAKKHGFGEDEIVRAWQNAIAMRYRNFDAPAIIAAAGADSHGVLMELLGGEQEDGTVVIFHAMHLTIKMASELDL